MDENTWRDGKISEWRLEGAVESGEDIGWNDSLEYANAQGRDGVSSLGYEIYGAQILCDIVWMEIEIESNEFIRFE